MFQMTCGSILFLLFLVGVARPTVAAEKVIIVGGGLAGLTTAFELLESGMDVEVEVYEKESHFGGKAVGYRDAAGLPHDHSPRIMIGNYFSFFDLLDRVPTPHCTPDHAHNRSCTMRDGLRAADYMAWYYSDDASAAPLLFNPWLATQRMKLTVQMNAVMGVSPEESAFFGWQQAKIQSSTVEEYNQGWDQSWTEWIDSYGFAEYAKTVCALPSPPPAEVGGWWCDPKTKTTKPHTDAFHKLQVAMMGLLVAAREDASVPSISNFFSLIYGFSTIPKYRDVCSELVLTGPSSEMLIDPLVAYLRSKGVKLFASADISSFLRHKARITGVVTSRGDVHTADRYVLAVPPMAATRILEGIDANCHSSLEWSVGFQFPLPAVPSGANWQLRDKAAFVLELRSPWQVGSMVYSPDTASSSHMWRKESTLPKGVGAMLSVAASKVHVTGVKYGKPLLECTRDEALREILTQMKFPQKVTVGGVSYGWDYMVEHAQLGLLLFDVDDKEYQRTKDQWLDAEVGPVKSDGKRWIYRAPLYIPKQGATPISTHTDYANLFLAGEHIASPGLIVPTMEHAVETGKLAAQATLDSLAHAHIVPMTDWLFASVGATTSAQYHQLVKKGIMLGPRYVDPVALQLAGRDVRVQ